MSEQNPVPPAPQPATPGQPPSEKKGFATTALVLGIVAILGSWIPFLSIGSILIGLVGLVFGIIAIVKALKGTAAGKVMAIIGTVLSALAIVFGFVSTAAGATAIDDAINEMDSEMTATTSAAAPEESEPASDGDSGDTGTDESATPGTPSPDPTDDGVETIAGGQHIVGTDISPGQYRATVDTDSLFELCTVTQESAEGDIMDIQTGNAGDVIFTVADVPGSIVDFSGCSRIVSTEDEPGELVSEITNGSYLVGPQIEPGQYSGTVDDTALIVLGTITQYGYDNSVIDLSNGNEGRVIFTVADVEGSYVSFDGLVDISKVS